MDLPTADEILEAHHQGGKAIIQLFARTFQGVQEMQAEFIGHRLRQKSQCGNDLGSKYDEIDWIKKGTGDPFPNPTPFM